MNLETEMLSALEKLDAKKELSRETIIRQAMVAGVDLGVKWQSAGKPGRGNDAFLTAFPPSNFFALNNQGKTDSVDGSKMKGEVRG